MDPLSHSSTSNPGGLSSPFWQAMIFISGESEMCKSLEKNGINCDWAALQSLDLFSWYTEFIN